MKPKRLNIGIDVSKLKLDVCILDEKKRELEYLQIFNTENGVRDFLKYLQTQYPKSNYYFGYEATNSYMRLLQKILTENEFKHLMINPHTLHHYFKYIGLKEKTDKSDSYGIALFISEKNDEEFDTKINYELKNKYQDYVTTIELLSKMKTQLKNLKNSKNNLFDEELEKEIENIEEKIKDIKDKIQNKAVKELKKDIPQFEEIKKEIKGVGDYTLLVILPLIATSKNKTAKEIQSYFGLNPVRYESGTSVMKKPKISKKGNSIARKVLYLSAMVAIRTNNIVKEKYERLIKNGKKKRVALTACMAHLLRAIYYQYHKLALNT